MIMPNWIGTVYGHGLNKGFILRFSIGFRVWHGTSEEGRNVVSFINKDEINSPNIISDEYFLFIYAAIAVLRILDINSPQNSTLKRPIKLVPIF